MIPLTILYDEYIDQPNLTEQKKPVEYIVPPSPLKGGRNNYLFDFVLEYLLKEEIFVQIVNLGCVLSRRSVTQVYLVNIFLVLGPHPWNTKSIKRNPQTF